MTDANKKTAFNSDTYRCSSCGAALKYKPGTSYMVCEYCSAHTPIDVHYTENPAEFDFNWHVQQFEKINTQATKIVRCKQCGAESTFMEHLKSMECPYCTSPLIESDIHEERLIKPSYLLPFHISGDQINNHLSQWLKKRWFIPGELKNRALHMKRPQGVYIPYWTYDVLTETDYSGERGDHYFVRVGSGKERRTEVRTRWSYVSGRVSLFFDDIMVAASKLVPSTVMNKIDGWDTQKLAKADSRFLSGFITEKYMINLPDGFEYAIRQITPQINSAIRQDMGGDERRVHSVDTRYYNVTFKLILLPVYMASYMYRNKVYHFFVNGRTGKIAGKRPYSVKKILMTVLIALGALLLFFIIGSL